ncbi:hypothetical protein C8E03_1194 [Lachnotalea glycerini]|uniref:Baseplate structural protein Gp10 C-terminal domain-containing protein n=1 Tax=Lachnotalea glycerini TaxID=1763509 RepID=A0A318EM30_9FIRM|nr:hypothetical protein [Lachnotalea glycerini]PXV85080.1 hypothetical protein C8E03_1194 [Lachnotalea glycerini]
MEITEHGLKKPASEDFYNVEDFNDNAQIIEEHLSDTDIHVNAQKIAEITEPDELTQIDITDTNSNMWGKLKKAITVISEHINQVATETTLGHIKIGLGLQISDGVASVNIATLLDKIYPIGSIYLSINNVSPAEFIGGTWERFAQGRTLIGVDTNNSSYIDSQKIGGSETTILQVKNMPAHTHSYSWTGKPSGSASTSVNIGAADNHYHNSGSLSVGWADIQGNANNFAIDMNDGIGTGGVFSGGASNALRGVKSPVIPNTIDNIYLNASHSHTVGGTTDWGGGHNHTVTASTSVNMNNLTINGTTGSSGNGSAVNNLQPFITCYMWKRIA